MYHLCARIARAQSCLQRAAYQARLQILRQKVVDVLFEDDARSRVDHKVHLRHKPLLVRGRQPTTRLQQVTRHDHDLRAQICPKHAALAVQMEHGARKQPVNALLACAPPAAGLEDGSTKQVGIAGTHA